MYKKLCLRKIGLTYRSLSGTFFSMKNNKEIQFESSLERDFIYLMEMDFNIINFLEQPFTIKYKDQTNKARRYTPDFIYEQYNTSSENNITTVVEIKYIDDLKKNHNNYKSKFNAAEDFCAQQGYLFKVLNEEDIRTPYLENCKFLFSYKNQVFDSENNILINSLLSSIKIQEATTPRKIIQSSSKNIDKQLELTYFIWHLISTNKISCNWYKSINLDSEIWIDKRF